MALQNLVSASLTTELKSSIMAKLNGLKTDLNFVISLLPEEKKEYLKVGNVMLPLIEKAHDAVTVHPEILPAIFDKEEFENDYKLTKDLLPIANQLAELTSAVQATLFAANSDSMVETLEIYAAVHQHQDKVPGLDTVAAEMKEFFKKTKKPKTEVK